MSQRSCRPGREYTPGSALTCGAMRSVNRVGWSTAQVTRGYDLEPAPLRRFVAWPDDSQTGIYCHSVVQDLAGLSETNSNTGTTRQRAVGTIPSGWLSTNHRLSKSKGVPVISVRYAALRQDISQNSVRGERSRGLLEIDPAAVVYFDCRHL